MCQRKIQKGFYRGVGRGSYCSRRRFRNYDTKDSMYKNKTNEAREREREERKSPTTYTMMSSFGERQEDFLINPYPL